MSESQHRYIPISNQTGPQLRPVSVDRSQAVTPGQQLDRLGRELRDLRISVIDQCNMRCGYCMPREVFHKDYIYLARDELLSFEEMYRVAKAFALLGTRKIRITGGEPLLRKGLEALVAQLSTIQTIEGRPIELALTTNGLLLASKAASLAKAGLQRVTVSLDALAPGKFHEMADIESATPDDVIRGIEASIAAGLRVKANMVVQRGRNDSEIIPMASRFRELGVTLRFIEFMDVGSSNGWAFEHVVPSAEVVERIHAQFPLERFGREIPSEVSERWRYRDGKGEIGFISSVTQPFCGDCSRARISAEGGLYTCLFASQGVDLRGFLRERTDDTMLSQAIAQVWARRGDRYSELRGEQTKKARPQGPRVEMSYIGG